MVWTIIPPEGWYLVWPINFKNVFWCLVSVSSSCLSVAKTYRHFPVCFWEFFSPFWKFLVTKYVIFWQKFSIFSKILVTKYVIFFMKIFNFFVIFGFSKNPGWWFFLNFLKFFWNFFEIFFEFFFWNFFLNFFEIFFEIFLKILVTKNTIFEQNFQFFRKFW